MGFFGGEKRPIAARATNEKGRILGCSPILAIGADERTRTFTPIKEQRPQRCASTNSATSALGNGASSSLSGG